MDMKLSVIMCAHRPREVFLGRTLAALRAQTLPAADWELLLVDNATEPPLAETWDLGWQPHARHLCESRLGLTHARLRGIAEARSEVLVFVDDDNVLGPDYLEEAVNCGQQASWLGAWGGHVEPEFVDGEPPAWTKEFWYYLAIQSVARVKWSNIPGANCSPVGAGMCVRREVARGYAELCRTDPRRRTLGRRGDSMASHEDTDMVYTATALGMGFGLFPKLRLRHLIPSTRLTEAYLSRLVYDSHRSYGVIKAIYGFDPAAPPGPLQRLRRWLTLRLRSGARERRLQTAINRGCEAGDRLAREVLNERSA